MSGLAHRMRSVSKSLKLLLNVMVDKEIATFIQRAKVEVDYAEGLMSLKRGFQPKAPDIKMKVIEQYQKGKKVKEIAYDLGLSTCTVYRWVGSSGTKRRNKKKFLTPRVPYQGVD